ncbi:DUF1080 domain-containing protein [Maribellus comscasis]|uniref:DUF1080 domain-containing protein n=1 Tax=Maribellus comscasis TaxID=2681766 RepID=A0A6I6JQZ5_9BACT|nr:DUF1080 domain-containing protein [Maribellus comscasis]QGY43470.1 DUF1080 domain-containing protein [Maribellus comscasis]
MAMKAKIKYQFLAVLAILFCGVQYSNAQKSPDILNVKSADLQKPNGSWDMEKNTLFLTRENPQKSRKNIWLKEEYGDFILELDFKLASGTNSGVFFRTKNTEDPVQTSIEVQIRDDYGKADIDKHFCGSIYEIKEVSENRVKKTGKWNHLKIICNGPIIQTFLNNKMVVNIDLNEWHEAGKNPDGTSNKFKTAYKNMPRKGKIGFQDHGGKIWYKNIKIKQL